LNLSIGGGIKSSRSKDLQDLRSFAAKQLCSLEGTALSSTNGRGQKINLSKAKVRFSGEGSDLSDSVKSLVSTVEKTAGLPRSQGYLLPRNDMRKKAAFTLAEVLITLGIIGVVAALTLPTLISNYQKRVYVNQLKKSYSVLSNGFRLMMAHDGVTELKDTTAFSGMLNENRCHNGGSGSSSNLLTDECRSMKEGLESVFSGIQFVPCNGKLPKTLNGKDASANALKRLSTSTCIQFPDGSEIIHFSAKKTGENVGIIVDINGAKNPNTVGRDIFWLYVNNNGHITGSYGEEESLNWRTATNRGYKCEMNGISEGISCAGRVLEEDAMNY